MMKSTFRLAISFTILCPFGRNYGIYTMKNTLQANHNTTVIFFFSKHRQFRTALPLSKHFMGVLSGGEILAYVGLVMKAFLNHLAVVSS